MGGDTEHSVLGRSCRSSVVWLHTSDTRHPFAVAFSLLRLLHPYGWLPNVVSGVTPHVRQNSQCHKVKVRWPSKEGVTSSISAGRPQCGQGQGVGSDRGELTTEENSSVCCRTMRMSRTFTGPLSGGNSHPLKVSRILKPCETFVFGSLIIGCFPLPPGSDFFPPAALWIRLFPDLNEPKFLSPFDSTGGCRLRRFMLRDKLFEYVGEPALLRANRFPDLNEGDCSLL